jgi:hypothetical protein
MTGATLDAYQHVPQILWIHLGKHLDIEPPDLGTGAARKLTSSETVYKCSFWKVLGILRI